jgi:Zn-dependent metalloprotease
MRKLPAEPGNQAVASLAEGAAKYTLTEDGFLRFLAARPGSPLALSGGGFASKEEAARAFVGERKTAFGVTSPQVTFSSIRTRQSAARHVVRLQQAYAGVPVFAAEMLVQLDADNRVESVVSDILRDTSPLDAGRIVVAPGLPGDVAIGPIRAEIEATAPAGADIAFSTPELTLYAPSVIGMEGEPQLVWKTRVSSDAAPRLSADLLIDAHQGALVRRFTRYYEAKDREVYDANNTTAEPGTLEREEGDPASGIAEVDFAYDFLGDTYDFYSTEHGRDAIDDAGATMSATVRRCTDDDCPWGNASWSGGRMRFGDGYADDDVTGHELTHGVTQNESGLIYENTPGAINESFSDIWGEFIDLVNGAGNDASSVRWLMGEDLPIGAIRDMSNPPAYGDPDRLGSPNYIPPVAVPNNDNDQGGVHTNSGIPNKLCYLLTDGDTFRGHTIQGLGISPVADLFYEVQVNLLTSSPDWEDFADAVEQAAVNLGWSQANKDNLYCALVAVELRDDTTDPTIACPSDITVECTATGGTPADDPQLAAFFAGVSADDRCGVEITNDAPSFFPDGETIVTFTATDPSGNSTSCTAKVTVVDTTDPVVVCPDDITVECSVHGGTPKDDPQLAAFFAGFSASDICDASLDTGDDAPALFPVGNTVVTYTATDDAGNSASCTATVTVEDTTPPIITVELSRDYLWPPNHKMADISATVEVTDICDPNPTFVLVSITSDEPINGLGDGDTAPDWDQADFGTDDVDFRLRSERAGPRDGRVYTILYRASDAAGNTADASATVNVAHDQSGLAKASLGFLPNGTAISPAARELAVILPSFRLDPVEDMAVIMDGIISVGEGAKPKPIDVQAGNINWARSGIGNVTAVVYPSRSYLSDIDVDGQSDLVLFYDADKVRQLVETADVESGPVGLHYSTSDGGELLVSDILTLGNVILPAIEVDVPGGGGGSGKLEPNAPDPGMTSPEGENLPAITRFAGIFPNPFQRSTTVALELSTSRPVRVSIYGPQGALVRTLVDGTQPAGRLLFTWDGRDDGGRRVAPGIYLVRVAAGELLATRKATLIW